MTEKLESDQKLLLASPLPNQTLIRERMASRYGNRNALTLSLVQSCAEVAESIMIEIFTSSRFREAVRIQVAEIQGLYNVGKPRVSGYTCPNCNHKNLRTDDNFCGGCGNMIQWVMIRSRDKK